MEMQQARDNIHGRWQTTKHRSVAHYCAAAVLLFLTGCSGSNPTYPVTGTVKLANGQPLAGGRILFQPTGEPSQPARAIIADDGTFKLGTFKISDGAVPGHHRVALYPRVPPDALNDPAAIARHRSIIDKTLQNVQTTPLEYTVKPDRSANIFDIVIKPTGNEKAKN